MRSEAQYGSQGSNGARANLLLGIKPSQRDADRRAMDLTHAIAIAGSPAVFAGQSDGMVVRQAQTGLAHSTAQAIPRFHHGTILRPVDVLLHLAYATRLNYERTVLDVYMQWALARYIGAFDVAASRASRWGGLSRLELSDAGRRVVGNQRRVFSEDVGIGLASLLARRWFASAHPGYDLDLVDIDVAIASRLIAAPPGARTDYLVVAPDRATGRVLLLGIVEAKGSESRANALRQIATGAGQLEATTVRRRSVPGLVSVAQSGRADLRYYLALVEPDEPWLPVDLGPARGATMALLNTAWAKIADFGDDPELYSRVAPKSLKDRRPSVSRSAQTEKSRVEVAGREYEGAEALIPLPGGRLRVFLGAETRLLGALREGAFGRAVSIKTELRRMADDRGSTEETGSRDWGSGDWGSGDGRVESASEDGVALVLRAE